MAKSKWPEVKENLKLVEKWAKDGLTEKQIAHNLGISVPTFEDYKKKYTELVKFLKKGREVELLEYQNALKKRAFGYEYEEKKVYTKNEDGKVITYTEITKKHQPGDVGALIFKLKNLDPENNTDNPQLLELKRQELELRKKLSEQEDW